MKSKVTIYFEEAYDEESEKIYNSLSAEEKQKFFTSWKEEIEKVVHSEFAKDIENLRIDINVSKGYEYTSQQGKQVTIDDIEEAKKVIIATATVRELSMSELLRDKDINDIAKHFSINLADLSVEINPDPYDFTYTYTFD